MNGFTEGVVERPSAHPQNALVTRDYPERAIGWKHRGGPEKTRGDVI